jgi:2'-hydroxyisoflavone reductase
VDDAFVEEHDVELPLWLPEKHWWFDQVDSGKARARGLAFRPLAETARDVLAWVAEAPEERTPQRLDPEREAELLREWHREKR